MAAPLPRSHLVRRLVLSVVIVGGALFGGVSTASYLAGLRKPAPLKDAEARRYNVEVFRPERVALQELITGFGTARADREVVLAAQVAGEVLQIHPQLKVGGRVKAAAVSVKPEAGSQRHDGDLLVTIDPRSYEERVIQVQNRLAEARSDLHRLQQEEINLDRLMERLQADYEDSQKELRKVQELRDKQIATDSDLRRAQMDLRQFDKLMVANRNDKDLFPVRREQTARRIESLQNDLKLAELDVERTTVEPPFSGEISRVAVERGQYVKPGDPLATLTDLAIVEVPIAVTLDDYARLLPAVEAGEYPSAALAIHESAAASWHGTVVRVAPKADEQTRTVMVYIRVRNAEQKQPLLPGTFLQARIDGPVNPQALVVPRDAVLNDHVFLLQNGRVVRRPVKLARTLQALAWVESGMEPGEAVILTNLDVLFDGAEAVASLQKSLDDELALQRRPVVRRARAATLHPSQPSESTRADSAQPAPATPATQP